jgi:hypothetical protein
VIFARFLHFAVDIISDRRYDSVILTSWRLVDHISWLFQRKQKVRTRPLIFTGPSAWLKKLSQSRTEDPACHINKFRFHFSFSLSLHSEFTFSTYQSIMQRSVFDDRITIRRDGSECKKRKDESETVASSNFSSFR